MSHPDRALFRQPASALFLPVLLFIITTPLATAERWTLVFYLIPIVALFYALWTRTAADAHAITVYNLRGRRRILWADLDGFEFHGPRWAIAVTMDGKRIRLPMVRPRDLSRLAAVSGGRLSLGEQPAPGDAAEEGEDVEVVVPGEATGIDVTGIDVTGIDVTAIDVTGISGDVSSRERE